MTTLKNLVAAQQFRPRICRPFDVMDMRRNSHHSAENERRASRTLNSVTGAPGIWLRSKRMEGKSRSAICKRINRLNGKTREKILKRFTDNRGRG